MNNKGQIAWNKGKKLSESHKENLRWKRTDFIPWNKGQHVGKIGAENNQWKGNGISYRSLHRWVERWSGKPKECSVCGKEKARMSWANIDHQYRRVLEDYIRMCPACHGEYDKVNNFRQRV